MYLLGDLFREGIGNHYVDSNLNNHFGTGPGAIFPIYMLILSYQYLCLMIFTTSTSWIFHI